MQQVITCTGYGWTGSSAATSLVEEFKDIKSLGMEFECSFLHESDGLRDLENALREGHRLKSDLAIKRFLRLAGILNKKRIFKKYFNGNFLKHAENFIDSISSAQWESNWHRGADTVKFSKEDLLYYNLAKQVFLSEYSYSKYSLFEPDSWHPSYHIRSKSCYAFFDDNFYIKAQTYICNLLREISLHIDTKKILIDQFFPAYNISAYLNYAPETKIIIVDRDPRDMYVLNKSSWGEPYIPTDNVDTFINWYRGIRFSQKKEIGNKNVLFFHFEDLIFNYESSLLRLKQFLGFSDKVHIKKKMCVDPDKSIKTTYKFHNYPQWKDDVLKIEKELKEYCYNFPNNLDNMITIDKNEPIEIYVHFADKVRFEKQLPLQYKNKINKLLFGMTNFGDACKSFSRYRVFKKKIKSFIKCVLFFFSFLFEYLYIIFIYYKSVKDKNEV